MLAMLIAALDPGRDKCGLAVLGEKEEIVLQRVISTEALEKELLSAMREFSLDCIVLGNGTTSKEARERIRKAFPELRIEVRDEYRTTEMARKEYWKVHPPTGWRSMFPVTLQVPPVPVDDFVAVILAKRYIRELEQYGKESTEPS